MKYTDILKDGETVVEQFEWETSKLYITNRNLIYSAGFDGHDDWTKIRISFIGSIFTTPVNAQSYWIFISTTAIKPVIGGTNAAFHLFFKEYDLFEKIRIALLKAI